MPRGRFVTFEGVEGTGKTTQLGLLADYLSRRGVATVATREPGGTPLGERLRGLLLDPAGDPVALAELLMLEAARAQLVARVVEPALAAGRWVLSDRFADSSLAYQGGARRLAPATVRRLNALACGDTVPDRTIVLELSVDVALARARRRPTTTASNRRFEDETMVFHRAVARAYRNLARREPSRVRLIDGSGTPAQVHERVVAGVADLLPRRLRPRQTGRRAGIRGARR